MTDENIKNIFKIDHERFMKILHEWCMSDCYKNFSGSSIKDHYYKERFNFFNKFLRKQKLEKLLK